MINRVLVILLIFMSCTSFGKNKLYILFNPDECTACSMGLKYMDSIQDVDRYFVFQEQYRSDSAQLIKQFYLSKYNCRFLFSDSLFQMTGKLGFSTVALVMDDGVHRFTSPLKLFNLYEAKRINLLNKDYFGFRLDHNRNSILESVGFKIWVLAGVNQDEIVSYDLFKGRCLGEVVVNDTVLDKSYSAYFNKPGVYKYHKNMLHLLEVPKPNDIRSILVSNDTIYIVSQNSYVDTVKVDNDIQVNGFYSIEAFSSSGKLIASHPIRNNSYGNNHVAPYVYKFNGFMYATLDALYDTVPRRSFIGQLQLNKEGLYELDKVLPFYLPDSIYKNNNYLNVLFDKGHFMLPLEGIVRDLKEGSIAVDLKLFDGTKNTCPDMYTQPSWRVYQFRYESNYVWVLYIDNINNVFRFVKYDVLQKSIVRDVSLPKSEFVGPKICDYNFNYVVFAKGDRLFVKRIFD